MTGVQTCALPISFSASLADVVSTVAWFLLATGIGGFFLGNVSDKIGRKRTLLISVLTYATGTLLCGFAHSIVDTLPANTHSAW